MLTRTRAVILAVAAMSLAACSNVHPGGAAVVDGQTISMKTLDKTAEAYCVFTLQSAKTQGVNAISNAEVRRQAVLSLVSTVIARDLAEAEGLKINPGSFELSEAQRDQIASTFPKADITELERALEDSQEVSAIAVALAAAQTGQTPSEANLAQLDELGRSVITDAFNDNDVKFAPRFGLSPDGTERASTGSLSVAPVDLEAPTPEELPDTQRCS